MKLSQKKNCSGCRAGYDGSCDLGFKTERGSDIMALVQWFRPAEPCYKPLTNSDWLLAREIRRDEA